jgi:hypothetical protein
MLGILEFQICFLTPGIYFHQFLQGNTLEQSQKDAGQLHHKLEQSLSSGCTMERKY